MQDPITVAFEAGAPQVWLLGDGAIPRPVCPGCSGSKQGRFTLFSNRPVDTGRREAPTPLGNGGTGICVGGDDLEVLLGLGGESPHGRGPALAAFTQVCVVVHDCHSAFRL